MRGELSVELQDLDDTLLAMSEHLPGEHLRGELRWPEGDLRPWQGRPVVLRFTLRHARFYSYRCDVMRMWDGAYGQERCRRCQRTLRCRFRRLKAAIAWWLIAHWWPIRWAGSLLRLMSCQTRTRPRPSCWAVSVML